MRSLEGADIEVWADAVRSWQKSLTRLSTRDFDIVLNGHEPAANLPIRRATFDHLVKHFGTMLNPWFSRQEPEVTVAVPVGAYAKPTPA